MGRFPLPETEVGVQAPVGQSVSPSPGQWDMVAALVARGPPSSTPHRADVHSGLIARTQFGQPDRGAHTLAAPFLQVSPRGWKRFPRVLMPPRLSSCLAGPTLHPGTQGAFPQG